MKKFNIFLAIFLAYFAMQTSFVIAKAIPVRNLVAEQEVATLKNIRNILIKTQEKISSCVKDGNPNKLCFCKYKRNYVYLNRLTQDMFEQYPAWEKDHELRYEDGDKSRSIMPAELKRQLDFKLRCVYTRF